VDSTLCPELQPMPFNRISNLPDIQFTRAVDADDFAGAFRCIYETYRRRGLAPLIPHEMRLTRHHLLPSTRVFVARRGREVVGTLSLVEDGPLGVPMRAVFSRHIDELTRSQSRVAEATCFAVRDNHCSDLEVIYQLMGLVAQSAHRRRVSRVLIAVHPRHAPFYERAAGFRPFAPTTPYPSVGGKLAVAMELNPTTIGEQAPHLWQKYFGYEYPEVALSPLPVASAHLQRMAAYWRAIHDGGEEFRGTLHEPGDQAAAA
jgi:hypothetical protein